ncbi:hypothetical protein HanIR_Chr04g0175511 [Helianthus annuus]|nr:hypothetical protein HanIR_Chr04g0175511 [Helianthus annuus]
MGVYWCGVSRRRNSPETQGCRLPSTVAGPPCGHQSALRWRGGGVQFLWCYFEDQRNEGFSYVCVSGTYNLFILKSRG